MEPDFWRRRWADNEIGFHESEVNALLKDHLPALQLTPGARVFVPLCGKSHDLTWLLAQGFEVVGCELSELAVRQFFEEQDLAPAVHTEGGLTCYRVGALQIWQGDIFALPLAALGRVDAIYDRAALIALPVPLRERYARLLAELPVPQLLITLIYDQSQMDGPPFSVDEAELERLYGGRRQIHALAGRAVEGGLKGQVAARELAWRLLP